MTAHLQARENSHPTYTNKDIGKFVTHLHNKGLDFKPIFDEIGSKFIICDSCFWCASTLNSYDIKVCPACKDDSLESFPISKRQHEIDNNNVSWPTFVFQRGFKCH